MNIIGWIIAVVGLVGIIFGIRMMLKGKKMQAVPFRKPSEIAQMGQQAADAKGLVSTEGQVMQPPQPLVAPMSGQPCLAYEIKVERKWEKYVQTENGQQKKTGTDTVHTEFRGSVFPLSDGAAQVMIDATQQPDVDLEKAHSQTVDIGMMIPGTLHFGQMQMNTPHVHGEGKTTAFVATEKVLKPSASLYALGALGPGQYGMSITTPKGIGTGKLILSNQGREKLLGKTKRNMILGYAFGAIFAIGGTGLGLFGPKAESTSCPSEIAGEVTCGDRMYSASGEDYTWTVSEEGDYDITISHPKLKFPVFPTIDVKDSSGTSLASDVSQSGESAHVVQHFAPGTYKLHVGDRDDLKVEGGFTINLAIKKSGSSAPAGSASAPNVEASAGTGKPTVAPAVAHPATKPGVKTTTKPAPTAAKPAPAPAPKPAPAPAPAKPAPVKK